MDHSASLSPVILLLPFIHLSNELEEGAFGHGRVSVHGPTQELELLHHPVAILRLEGGGKDNSYPRLIHICRGEGVNRCCIKMQSDCKDAGRVKLSFIRGWIEMVKGHEESLKR